MPSASDFLNSPQPTILPQDSAGTPALPLSSHMVAGSPFPQSAQMKLRTWNRYLNASTPMPAGVTYNAPRNRLVQT